MRKLFLLVLFMSGCVAPLCAQDDYHKAEVFVGYSHNRVDTGFDDDDDLDDIFDNREGFHGFNASVKGNVSRYVGLKFDYSYHTKDFGFLDTRVNVHNILGGVEIKDNSRTKRVKPFAHFLAGAARETVRFDDGFDTFNESDTGFAAVIGGGVDVRVSPRVDIRAFQFDYNPTRFGFNGGGSQTFHNFRIGVGLVFH